MAASGHERLYVGCVRTCCIAFVAKTTRHSSQVARQHVTEDAVMASEIEQLADLRGYLKVASRPE
jgi:hypothetical protein